MTKRAPLSIEQTDKVLLISQWLFKFAIIQRELQMAERWDLLEDLRQIYVGLSTYLVRVVGGLDDLDSDDWEARLFSGLIKDPAKIAAHKESVEAGVSGAIFDLFEKDRR